MIALLMLDISFGVLHFLIMPMAASGINIGSSNIDVDPKQWDGLPLPERALKCQTGVSTQPVMRKGVHHENCTSWRRFGKGCFSASRS